MKNATREEELARRNLALKWLREDKSPSGNPPYAIAYGFVTKNGTKKLLENNPVFFSSASFDLYVRKHKMIVLAVYNKNFTERGY